MFVHSLRPLAAVALATTTLTLAGQAMAEKHGAHHIFATPAYYAKAGRATPDAQKAGQMRYYGGSVLASAKVVSVIWGSGVAATTVAGIPGFSAALVNSTYVDQMSQYDTFLNAVDGRQGTQQHITRGEYLGQVQITPHNTSLNLSDADVQAELKLQIKRGALPKRDLNTLYMVYFPSNVTITLDGALSCSDFYAYHSAINDKKLSKSNVFYTVEPDCGGDLLFDFNAVTLTASHEFVEAVTDNVPTPGSNPAFPQAWNNDQGYEIGDLCVQPGQLMAGDKVYTVTQYYSNTTGRCTKGNYTSP